MGKVDSYIHDLITVAPHIRNSTTRVANAFPLALDIVGRPLSQWELIPRADILSMTKLQTEGSMCEMQTITEWVINTREFTISLTLDKLNMWFLTINDVIKNEETHHKEIDSLIERLNHAGYINPQSRHFLHPRRNLYTRCLNTKNKKTEITEIESRYLNIWLKILQNAKTGIFINNIIF